MPTPRTIRLRERDGPPPRAAEIIDAQYRVVRPRNSSPAAKLGTLLIALFWAAVLGFAVPKAWLFFHEVGAYYVAMR